MYELCIYRNLHQSSVYQISFHTRVLLSKALSCDRLPEESDVHNKFEHHISEGTYYTQGLRQKASIVFIVQRKILSENCQKRAPAEETHYGVT